LSSREKKNIRKGVKRVGKKKRPKTTRLKNRRAIHERERGENGDKPQWRT